MKEAYLREYDRNPVFTLFLTILIIFFIISAVVAILTNGDSIRLAMVYDSENTFMDYFHSIMFSSDRPYEYWTVMYPTLITTIYAALGRFIIPFVDAAPGETLSFAMKNTQMGMMSLFVITILTFFLLHWIFKRVTKNTDLRTNLLFLMMLLSFPFIFALERGNSIILTLAFCLLFLLGYRSENKYIRYASYVALGFAAGIKLYPAILLLLIFRDRNIKEGKICLLIVAALLLIPFVFTDGNPMIYLSIIVSYSDVLPGVTNINQITTEFLYMLLGIPEIIALVISYIILGIFTLLSVIVVLFDREMKFWKVIALLSCNLVIGFGMGCQYQMVYMTMPILYFLIAEREMTKENKFYTVCFAMTMVMMPGIIFTEFHPSWVIGAVGTSFTIVMSIALLREGIGRIRRNRRNAIEQSCDASV
jgi:hypothetical protein